MSNILPKILAREEKATVPPPPPPPQPQRRRGHRDIAGAIPGRRDGRMIFSRVNFLR